MRRLKNYITIITFCCISSDIYSQDIFEKWGNRLFFKTLKHEIWRPYFDLGTLKTNDSIYIWSRRADRKNARAGEGKYIRKHNGDIWFKRNGKILRRTYKKINWNKAIKETHKLEFEWVVYGHWRRDKGLLIIEINNFFATLEWYEQARDIIDLRVIEAKIKSSH